MTETLETFPCFYTFKVFGHHSDTFAELVRDVVGWTLGPVSADSMKVRESAGGRYLSVSIYTRVDSRAQLDQIYADLRAEREVLLYI